MNDVQLRVEALRKPVLQIAVDYRLPAGLVLGIIEVESGGDPWAPNPEPPYRYLWDVINERPFRPLTDEERKSEKPPKDFRSLQGDPDQEWWCQQMSWGLMQVMGAVAREHGCRLPYLTQLCDPGVNLIFGCRHLAVLIERHARSGDITLAVAAYNAGSPRKLANGHYENQAYVDKVLKAARGYGFAE